MMNMLSKILAGLAICISVILILLTHRFTDEPRSDIKVHASVFEVESGASAEGIRFDLLRTSMVDLIDSLSRIDVLSADRSVRVFDDEQREAYLRSVIEYRSFVLSRLAAQSLQTLARVRSAYLDHIQTLSSFSFMIEALRKVHGPVIEISTSQTRAVWPEQLQREHRLYSSAQDRLLEAAADNQPDDRAMDLFRAWTNALENYTILYHRDLLERTILTADLYRDIAVATAVTDSLGRAVLPPVAYGSYHLAGFYPVDRMQLVRRHRLRMLQRLNPSLPDDAPVIIWDHPIRIDAPAPEITVTPKEAVVFPAQ